MKLVYTPRVEHMQIEINGTTIEADVPMDLSTITEVGDLCNKAKEAAHDVDIEMKAASEDMDGQALRNATGKGLNLTIPVIKKALGEKTYKEICEAFGGSIPLDAYPFMQSMIREITGLYTKQTIVSREKAAHYLQETEDARAAANGTE